MEHEKNTVSEIGLSSGSSTRSIIFYIAVCIVGLAVLLTIFNQLIAKHDRQLTAQICSLVTEKVTSSIEYMTKSAADLSAVMSHNTRNTFADEYDQLRASLGDADYLSIGLLLPDGTIYATESEKNDLEKWDLVGPAMASEGVAISQPYRSSLTGQLVFTMFSGIDRGDERLGCLFITYPLDEILKITHSDSLGENAEIWLMDGASDNIINCSGTEDYLIGSWGNFKLNKDMTGNALYDDWARSIHEGAPSGYVTYSAGSDTYTQVFEKLGFMDGWHVVVRIPNSELSSTMQIYRWAVIVFALVVIAATIILLISTKRRSDEEKRILENLSIYDPLSQVMNRRAFGFSARQYLERAGRDTGAVMFLDIDLFKGINDKYGHDAGDHIIVSVASALKDMFGSCGLVSRYGGDEFVVLIRNKGKDEISAMLTRLQEIMRQVKITDDPDDDFELHFSAGLAEFPKDGSEAKELLKCADAALYIVKENGRNGFGWYEPAE